MIDVINNTDDLIAGSDILDRIEELTTLEETVVYTDRGRETGLDEEEEDELIALRSLVEEVEQCAGAEWPDGATLISDNYFEEYARQYAENIGAIGSDGAWPTNHIDWDAAADEIKVDYTKVDFDGVEFWVEG